MRRSLSYYWRTHLAVVLGAAVTTAVLTGALAVGDSLQGSLRQLTLDRLGTIEWAVLGERPFRRSLADDLGAEIAASATVPPVAVLYLGGSATEPESGARAARITVWGVDDDFWALYPGAEALDLSARSGPFPAAALNVALANELGVSAGDPLVLAFERPSDVPRETLVGRSETDEAVALMRVSVAAVLDDRGPGGLGLRPRQTRTLNVFVDRSRLQRTVLGRADDRVNALVGAGGGPAGADAIEEALHEHLQLDDLGISLRRQGDVAVLESRQFVLAPERATAIEHQARELDLPLQPVLTYLANALTVGDRSVPYSTVSALEPPLDSRLGSFLLTDGQPAPNLEDDEILLNAWAAAQLGASIGDTVDMAYYSLGSRDELSTDRRSLRLRGIVAMSGLAIDPYLTPEFPGIEGADDIADWNPPFPVDLGLITPRDEDYWDRYRSAPKAFVSLALGAELWQSRFGSLTSLRIAAPPAAEATLVAALRQQIDPGSAGFSVRRLREEGLRAASGATDFAGLFLGLSLFLIVSAALLAGLLFRLGVERRAAELGLLRAVGFPVRRIRRRFLIEGLILAALGALVGLAGGVGYAAAMLAGLRSWWLPAIGEPVLFLHVVPSSLVLGAMISIVVVTVAIALSLRRLGRLSPVGLLNGSVEGDPRPASRRALWVAGGGLALALALTATSFAVSARAAAGLAFGVGAALLVSGIAWFGHRSARPSPRANAIGRRPALTMAARSSFRSRARSLLCVALMASASFVIVVVAANRVHPEIDVSLRSSGAGGFSLVAESDVAVVGQLVDEAAEVESALSGAAVMPFRLLPGEDVSCLNLYQPERPRVLGAPPEMIARGGFAFQQVLAERANPWSLLDEPLPDGAVPAIGDYNSMLWILKAGLGDDIVVDNERGEPVRLRLVGLLKKSLFQSELVISERNFERSFPGRAGYSYFLLDPAPERAAGVATALERALGRLGFDAVSTRERLAAFQAVEDTYLSTFQTLGALGLLLGTVGMGIILLRNVLERRAELATLRALGYRRRRLRALVLLENAFLLVIGLAIGAGAGAVAVTPHLVSAGQGLPWSTLIATLAGVLVIGMAASALAVRSVARMPLLASLRAK